MYGVLWAEWREFRTSMEGEVASTNESIMDWGGSFDEEGKPN